MRAGVPAHFVNAIFCPKDNGRLWVRDAYFRGLTLAQLTRAIEKLKLPIDIDALLEARRRSSMLSEGRRR
ncbi:hypothetical protein [Phreatobacter sp.]|uniref:hypothetical protein n=1 Tax=Phreatobacter sp. TaxID=1966341 RepID=UPI0025FE11DC|nr:hypothetical protein [Phreatobacter sp.]